MAALVGRLMLSSNLPISDDLLAVNLTRPGASLAAGLRARAPGPLDPLGGARLGVAALVGWLPECHVAETLVYYFQVLARPACDVTCLETCELMISD